jgi:integrase
MSVNQSPASPAISRSTRPEGPSSPASPPDAPDALLFRREDGGAWGKSHQQRPLLEACANARIQPPASFHILRHTYASQRIMNGAPLIVIAQALGHGDTRMVEKHYGHLARGYVQQVIEATGMDLGDGAERPEVVRLQRF